MAGSIPVTLGNLTNLQRLWLGYNQLRGSIPVSLGKLTNLRRLWLSDNQLTGPIPAELGNLNKLDEYLVLGGTNRLTGCIPEQWRNLRAGNDLATLGLHFCSAELAAPTDLTATGRGANAGEVKLSWTPGANATVHQVVYQERGSDAWEWWARELPGSVSETTITGLTAGQEHWFAVRAVWWHHDGSETKSPVDCLSRSRWRWVRGAGRGHRRPRCSHRPLQRYRRSQLDY